jgi:hypothetical protein
MLMSRLNIGPTCAPMKIGTVFGSVQMGVHVGGGMSVAMRKWLWHKDSDAVTYSYGDVRVRVIAIP